MKNLRHAAAATGQLDHLLAQCGILGDVDFLESHALLLSKDLARMQ